MKSRIIFTLIISSAVFWSIILIGCIAGLIEIKKHPLKHGNMAKDKYGTLCMILNLTGGFVLFEILSCFIAFHIKSIMLIIILHIPAWWISAWTAHRILPHLMNRIADILSDNKTNL